jgi:hypothetical protein
MNDLIYVYCILNSPPDLNRNFELEGLQFLVFDQLYVIIKYVSEGKFSEENLKSNLSDIQWLKANEHEHIGIIKTLMKYDTVIPLKFPTIFKAEDSLKMFITDNSDSLTENFHHIKGMEEWSVQIYCDRKLLSEKIDELSEETATLEKQIMASSPGKAFLLKRDKTELIEKEIDRICKNYGQECFNEFRNHSQSTNLKNLLPEEYTERNDTMILNAAFLVNKDIVTDFTSTVDVLRKKVEISSFFIETIGPWPPFSFISFKRKS